MAICATIAPDTKIVPRMAVDLESNDEGSCSQLAMVEDDRDSVAATMNPSSLLYFFYSLSVCDFVLILGRSKFDFKPILMMDIEVINHGT